MQTGSLVKLVGTTSDYLVSLCLNIGLLWNLIKPVPLCCLFPCAYCVHFQDSWPGSVLTELLCAALPPPLTFLKTVLLRQHLIVAQTSFQFLSSRDDLASASWGQGVQAYIPPQRLLSWLTWFIHSSLPDLRQDITSSERALLLPSTSSF